MDGLWVRSIEPVSDVEDPCVQTDMEGNPYVPTHPPTRIRKPMAPASGRMAIRHSGIAKVEPGVATRTPAPWKRPAPPPMTIPSATATTGFCSAR